jgi:hypothetical protein
MFLTEEQKNDELVKSLLGSGFSEEVILGWIETGAITFEKSVSKEDPDEEDPDEEGGKKDPDKKGDKEDPDNVEKGCGDKEKDDLAKSITSEIVKSIENRVLEGMKEKQDDILKSLPAIVEGAMQPIVDKIEKSLDGMRQAIIVLGDQAPKFKSQNLSKAIIEKSLETGGGVKDSENKTVLSVTKDRSIVRELIAKSISEETDPELQKSLREGTNAYMIDPICGEVSKEAAMYLYGKKNIRLVK